MEGKSALMAVEFGGGGGGDEKSGGEGRSVMVPPALEFLLLNQSNKLNAGSGGGSTDADADADTTSELTEGTFDTNYPTAEREVGALSKMGNTIAMCDLQGQTAPEFDWYKPDTFVCWHCLQPATGLPIGYPLSMEKCAQDGRTIWITHGRFGSVGCAIQYANHNRYTFAQETAGYLPLMLLRVYGFKGDLTCLPLPPARRDLPPFNPAAPNRQQFNPYTFHDALKVPMNPPDPKKHCIVSYHSALIIDSHVPLAKLPFKAQHLKRMLPNLYSKPKPIAPTFSQFSK
jgi:hypothetical protein